MLPPPPPKKKSDFCPNIAQILPELDTLAVCLLLFPFGGGGGGGDHRKVGDVPGPNGNAKLPINFLIKLCPWRLTIFPTWSTETSFPGKCGLKYGNKNKLENKLEITVCAYSARMNKITFSRVKTLADTHVSNRRKINGSPYRHTTRMLCMCVCLCECHGICLDVCLCACVYAYALFVGVSKLRMFIHVWACLWKRTVLVFACVRYVSVRDYVIIVCLRVCSCSFLWGLENEVPISHKLQCRSLNTQQYIGHESTLYTSSKESCHLIGSTVSRGF